MYWVNLRMSMPIKKKKMKKIPRGESASSTMLRIQKALVFVKHLLKESLRLKVLVHKDYLNWGRLSYGTPGQWSPRFLEYAPIKK